MSGVLVKLPTKEELLEWIAANYSHLNPDYRDFFVMGIEALYVKLGGEKFITIK